MTLHSMRSKTQEQQNLDVNLILVEADLYLKLGDNQNILI